MSLRLRLLLLIGVALSLLWGGVAVWMQHDVEWQMRRALDQRLEMSAKMVAGLMAQHPEAWADVARKSRTVALGTSSHMNELVCQVSSLRGEIYARTPGPAAVSLAPVRTGFGNQTIGRHEWRIYTLEANG
ncbi:MAG TPA: sensor histidine kinase N-terminal domain-containing protein, partial [Burkholderiaceae bacterium]